MAAPRGGNGRPRATRGGVGHRGHAGACNHKCALVGRTPNRACVACLGGTRPAVAGNRTPAAGAGAHIRRRGPGRLPLGLQPRGAAARRQPVGPEPADPVDVGLHYPAAAAESASAGGRAGAAARPGGLPAEHAGGPRLRIGHQHLGGHHHVRPAGARAAARVQSGAALQPGVQRRRLLLAVHRGRGPGPDLHPRIESAGDDAVRASARGGRLPLAVLVRAQRPGGGNRALPWLPAAPAGPEGTAGPRRRGAPRLPGAARLFGADAHHHGHPRRGPGGLAQAPRPARPAPCVRGVPAEPRTADGRRAGAVPRRGGCWRPAWWQRRPGPATG